MRAEAQSQCVCLLILGKIALRLTENQSFSEMSIFWQDSFSITTILFQLGYNLEHMKFPT